MNIQEQLLIEHSKANSELIRDYIGVNAKRFENLLDLFEAEEYRISQRAAMVISACFDEHPKMVTKYLSRMIENLFEKDDHVPVKRNTLRIFQFMEVPDEYKAKLFDYCLEKLYSTIEAIAVKAFAMQVACNIALNFPELSSELINAIHLNMETDSSPGIQSRGRRVLRQLAKR